MQKVTIELTDGYLDRLQKLAVAMNKFRKTINDPPFDKWNPDLLAQMLIQDGIETRERTFSKELGKDEYRWHPFGKEEAE